VHTQLDFANIDFDRAKRTGYPEVVYCAGKTDEQSLAIIRSMREQDVPVLATRAGPALAKRVHRVFHDAEYDEIARTIGVGCAYYNAGHPVEGKKPRQGLVVALCAGTSDLPQAREAARTAAFFGSRVSLISDVGVAVIHRLFERLDYIRKARCVIAAAGMEGALPGVVAGLVSVPVIALPTSVGYGASFGGIAALLTMLNSCAPGVSVVNIDNGFGAGYQANLINMGRYQ
jgi:NCAIR mutase (PurE)-related protein